MADVFAALASIASRRPVDPLAPVTVIVPSHAAALHLRRRLAAHGPYAAVRFETLPRVAELLAAGHLAAAGRSPLARPIGDCVAERVARGSGGDLAALADLPGYARVLRRVFRRLRRGGIRTSSAVDAGTHAGHFQEVLRLYDLFRGETARFYDEEDLLRAAAEAVRSREAGVLSDLGEIYVVPPAGMSADSSGLLGALRETCPAFLPLDEPRVEAETRFVLAPDPASEAREVVREVIAALEGGAPMHEVAVFHGADASYPRLLREAFAAAGVPAVPLPGVPLIDVPAGRGAVLLALLPEKEFARTAVVELMAAAPLRGQLPGRSGTVRLMASAWDRLSREAGVTRGADVWNRRLSAFMDDCRASAQEAERRGEEARARAAAFQLNEADRLLEVIEVLAARLRPLGEEQAAASFIPAFKRLVDEYFDPQADGLPEVLGEIDQLGTIAAVGGRFSLATFAQALRANLEVAVVRPLKLDEGVVLADYRAAAGMRFRHVVLCGAYEGALPAGPGSEPLLEERVWERLRSLHPFVEDAALRMQRAREAALRASAAATGVLVWSAPAYEAGGTREWYPSPLMVEAASLRAGTPLTASDLRRGRSPGPWLRRGASPIGLMLRGSVVDRAELGLRQAVALRRGPGGVPADHARSRALSMLRARRSGRFTEWDGNLGGLCAEEWLRLPAAVSPTALEAYAVCGFRYLCRSLFRLNTVEEPEERETIDAGARGRLVHRALQRFFEERRAEGRPRPGEPWLAADEAELLRIAGEELAAAAERGLTGLDIFSEHEARILRMDLLRFLKEDAIFREETGAVPVEFELPVEAEVAGIRLRGFVDRVDRTPDGGRAWVIDYKTGSQWDFRAMKRDAPLAGGRKLQLPAYVAATGDAQEVQALYWFITRNGGFERLPYEPTPENQALFERTLATVVAGIRAGAFPAVSGPEDDFRARFDNCAYCDFDRICSRRREYELERKREDASMSPWLNVALVAGAEAIG